MKTDGRKSAHAAATYEQGFQVDYARYLADNEAALLELNDWHFMPRGLPIFPSFFIHFENGGGNDLNKTKQAPSLQLNLQEVRSYMQNTGLGPVKLADRMGVSYNTLRRVLNGERNAGPAFVAGLLLACEGTTFDQFFTVSGKEQEV